MTDCECQRTSAPRFDGAYAAQRLARYRERGPDRSTRALIAALCAESIEGMTLLDIGGGVGAVQHELLRAGVVSVQEVEASAAYMEACRAEAERRGHPDRIHHILGEFGTVADEVEDADIVTLDRSICCWPDMAALAGESASKARRLYGLVYPRDAWWVRHGWRLISAVRAALGRHPMRVFIHRSRDVESILDGQGLVLRSSSQVGVWQVVVYRRADRGDAGAGREPYGT